MFTLADGVCCGTTMLLPRAVADAFLMMTLDASAEADLHSVMDYEAVAALCPPTWTRRFLLPPSQKFTTPSPPPVANVPNVGL